MATQSIVARRSGALPSTTTSYGNDEWRWTVGNTDTHSDDGPVRDTIPTTPHRNQNNPKQTPPPPPPAAAAAAAGGSVSNVSFLDRVVSNRIVFVYCKIHIPFESQRRVVRVVARIHSHSNERWNRVERGHKIISSFGVLSLSLSPSGMFHHRNRGAAHA